VFVDALQVEIHNKNDIKPRKNESNQYSHPHHKKPRTSLFMDKFKELNNIPKAKEAGDPSKREQEVKKLEQIVPPFNIKNELSNINILVPLMELVINPSYYKQIEKMIQVKGFTNHVDIVNLQDECSTIVFFPHIDHKEESIAPF
jgi:hypothetical protein